MHRLFKHYTTWVAVFVAALFALPYGYQHWSEAQAWRKAVPVAVADFQPGTVRLVQGLWITSQPGGEFYVFLNHSDFYPDRPLTWVATDGQFEEPISSARYGIDGVGQFGPAGHMYRVESRLDGDHLVVVPTRIVSGGPGAPAWFVDLKHFFSWVTTLLKAAAQSSSSSDCEFKDDITEQQPPRSTNAGCAILRLGIYL